MTLGGTSLKKGAMYNEVLTRFTWDGNGRGFLLVVPDSPAAGLLPSLDAWTMMTAAPWTKPPLPRPPA